MRTLSSRLPLIRRIGHKIKIWPKESAVAPTASPSRVTSSHRNRPVGFTTGMARTHSSCDTAGADRPNAQPEYWFSTDAYITTADKRHLHFDRLRRVHLTFRMHFAGRAHLGTLCACACEKKLSLTYIYHPMLHAHAYSRLYLSRAAQTLWRYLVTINLSLHRESRIKSSVANTLSDIAYRYACTCIKKIWIEKNIGKLLKTQREGEREASSQIRKYLVYVPEIRLTIQQHEMINY